MTSAACSSCRPIRMSSTRGSSFEWSFRNNLTRVPQNRHKTGIDRLFLTSSLSGRAPDDRSFGDLVFARLVLPIHPEWTAYLKNTSAKREGIDANEN